MFYKNVRFTYLVNVQYLYNRIIFYVLRFKNLEKSKIVVYRLRLFLVVRSRRIWRKRKFDRVRSPIVLHFIASGLTNANALTKG